MAADSAPEKLRLQWVQAQALAVLAHLVLVLPVDKNKILHKIEKGDGSIFS